MVEADHTSEQMFGLFPPTARGRLLWAGEIIVSDAETLDTGLDTIEGCAFIEEEDTDGDANTGYLYIKSISGGTITFCTGAVGAYANMTDMTAFGIVVGSCR